MKEIQMFYLAGCPFCIRARQYMQELQQENPAYNAIPIVFIEEREECDLAHSYDYFYVPSYYIGEEKIAEGAITKEGVRAVFEKALEE